MSGTRFSTSDRLIQTSPYPCEVDSFIIHTSQMRTEAERDDCCGGRTCSPAGLPAPAQSAAPLPLGRFVGSGRMEATGLCPPRVLLGAPQG